MFTGGVESTNDNDIDLLMGIVTPGADNIVAGKKKTEDGDGQEDNPDDDDPEADLPKAKNLPKRAKIEDDPLAAVSKKPTDVVTDELFGEDEPETGEDGLPKKKDPKPTVKAKPSAAVEPEFKAIYEHFVAEKIWGEVEVPEDFVWDAEGFKEIQALQDKSRYDDLLDRTGEYGKKIIQYEKDGGNPGELLELFREQRTVQEFDVTTPEGQEEFLTSYLEAQGYSVKSIDRTIKALIDQGGDALKEEAEEKKSLWDQQYNEEIEQAQQQQALLAKQMAEQVRNFNKNISDTLTSDAELTPKDKKDLSAYILNYSQKYNGHDVSQFYLDMTEIQKDPASYVELAKFIKGLKTGEYKKKIEASTKKKVSAQTFLKVKNGAALTGGKGGETPLNNGEEESSFVTYLRKK